MRPSSDVLRPRRILILAFALSALPGVRVGSAADGDLDAAFYPPDGSIGLVGGGLVADGGLVAPDGMAIAYYRQPDATVAWHTFSGELGAETFCPFNLSLATDAEYHDAIFDGQGRLVLVGTATFPVVGDVIFAVRYLYPECEQDDSFNDDGYFAFDLPEDLEGWRVRRQTFDVFGLPIEKLIIAGDRRFSSGGPGGDDFADTIVLRLDGNGELDQGFEGDGWVSLDVASETQLLADFVVDHQERIVFGANVDLFGADPDFVLGRLTSTGALDPDFDGDGWKRMRFASGADDFLGAMEVAANDDIVLAGTADVGDARHIGVLRLNGSGTQGALIETAGSLSFVSSSALQGDRKLVLAGWSNGFNGDADIFALRVNVPLSGPPAVDPTFGDGAEEDPLTYFELDSFDLGTDAAWSVDLAGGKPVLFGEQNFGDPQGLFVARLENSYIFVDGFESGDTGAW